MQSGASEHRAELPEQCTELRAENRAELRARRTIPFIISIPAFIMSGFIFPIISAAFDMSMFAMSGMPPAPLLSLIHI